MSGIPDFGSAELGAPTGATAAEWAKAFEEATGYHAPGWNEMLEELGAEVRQRQGEKVW